MEYIVERIQEEFVILEREDLSHLHAAQTDFAFEVKAGDVVREENGTYVLDEEKTSARRAHLQKLTRDLFRKGKQ